MSSQKVEDDIQDYKDDIISLEDEIEKLENQFQHLQNRCDELERKQNGTISNSPPRKHSRYDDVVIPPTAKHIFFDPSIANLFTATDDIKENQEAKRRKMDQIASLVLRKNVQRREMIDNILLENIFRIGGLSAFPINDLFQDSENLLGLRIDLLSASKFMPPHYIILKKNPKNEEWMIFKHTLPNYLPLHSITEAWLNIDMDKFVREIRSYTLKIQYKHDKLDILSDISFDQIHESIDVNSKIISKIERDLQAVRPKITVNPFKGFKKIEMEFVCSLVAIEDVYITGVDAEDKRTLCESLLRGCEFKDVVRIIQQSFRIFWEIEDQ